MQQVKVIYSSEFTAPIVRVNGDWLGTLATDMDNNMWVVKMSEDNEYTVIAGPFSSVQEVIYRLANKEYGDDVGTTISGEYLGFYARG